MSDLVLLNGRIRTMDPKRPCAEALIIEGNRVAFAGSNAAAREKADERSLRIDLEGRTVLPGLTSPPNRSVEEIVKRVAEWTRKTPPGEWILGWGYDDTKLREKRHPTRDDLDRVAPDHPVYLTRACGHLGVANSLALKLAGIDDRTANPRGGHIHRDGNGRATGVLSETAQALVREHMPGPTPGSTRRALREVGQDMARRGITSIWDAGVGRGSDAIRTYRELQAAGDFPVRVNLAIGVGLLDELEGLSLPPGFGDDLLRVTAVKLMLDGSVSGHTAALHEPFCGSEDVGLIYMPQSELNDLVLRVHNLGFQAAIHAIGDRAVDSALDAIENAQLQGASERLGFSAYDLNSNIAAKHDDLLPELAKTYRGSPRHRIEHCSLTSIDRILRLRELGVLPVPQPIFIYGEGHSYLEYLGEERSRQAYTLRSFLDHGIPAPLSTDCPATSWHEPLDPFLNMAMAMTRTTEGGQSLGDEQTVSAFEALRSYTLYSAFASFDEGRKGVLRPGYLADVIVLNDDPVKVLPGGMDTIRVEMTILNGELVYQAE